MRTQIEQMMEDAIACETQFASDVLSGGVAGLSVNDMRQYLEYCADQRLVQLDLPKKYGTKNPFDFMDLQDVQEVTNFFERRVSAYQVGVQGEVAFDMSF
jgi:ribonucleoside-diphosphate reductase beta chain